MSRDYFHQKKRKKKKKKKKHLQIIIAAEGSNYINKKTARVHDIAEGFIPLCYFPWWLQRIMT